MSARVKAILLRETDNAFRIQQDEDEPVWIPRSQVSRITKHPEDELGQRIVEMDLPGWLCREKNLFEE